MTWKVTARNHPQKEFDKLLSCECPSVADQQDPEIERGGGSWSNDVINCIYFIILGSEYLDVTSGVTKLTSRHILHFTY